MKEMQGFVSTTPNGETVPPRKGTPNLPTKVKKPQKLPLGVPQTDV